MHLVNMFSLAHLLGYEQQQLVCFTLLYATRNLAAANCAVTLTRAHCFTAMTVFLADSARTRFS